MMDMPVGIDAKVHHVIVVLGSRGSMGELVDLINSYAIKSGVKRLFIHVISRDGKPKYFEKIRHVLQTLTYCTVIVKHEGSSYSDFIRLVKSIQDLGRLTVVLVGDGFTGIEDVIKELGINYVTT